MTALPEARLTLQDVPRMLSKYRRSIIAGSLMGLTVFTAASFVLPSKYKVSFVLTIDPKYFQSPLIGEFIPQLGSGFGEMKSQGDSLLRQALTPEFLDSLGRKYGVYSLYKGPKADSWYQRMRVGLKTLLVYYGLYRPSSGDYALPAERQALLSHIEIYSVYNTTYEVGFIYSNPDVAYHVAQDIYAQAVQVLLDLRRRNLANIRDAIQRRLESLTDHLDTSPAPASTPGASSLPLIREQLEQVRNQISALSAQYTEEHPLMQELRNKERVLARQLNASLDGGVVDAPASLGKPAIEGDANRAVYSDLTRKLNYLKIAIDSDQERQGDYFALLKAPLYPASPLWPKKPLFVIWGLAFGLFCSLFSAAIREYFDRSALRAETLAHHLKIPLLGGLPAFKKPAGRR